MSIKGERRRAGRYEKKTRENCCDTHCAAAAAVDAAWGWLPPDEADVETGAAVSLAFKPPHRAQGSRKVAARAPMAVAPSPPTKNAPH